MQETEIIFSAITATYSITTQQLISRSREGLITEARQMAMYILYRRQLMTQKEVAKVLKRTYPTVGYAIRKMEFLIKNDKRIRSKYELIKQRLE